MAGQADLAIILTAKDQASSVIAGVNKEVGGFGGIVQGVAGAAMTAFAGAAVAVGAGLAASVSSAADFEKQMSAIKAVSGATGAEMSTLQQLALDLGKSTSFSASEAAKGIGELIKAGVSIGDVMGGGAQAALDLAAAGAIEVGDAAEIASNAMNAFGLKGSDMAHVADVIAGAANASAIDVNDFKFSLAAVGAVANAAGLSFDDTAVAIAELGQAGIKGSDAGTSLKTFIAGLTPSSKEATKAMRELGLITADGANQFFTAEGKMKSMAEIQELLQNATAGLTEQQRLMAFETIFGSDAIRAAAVLSKQGAEGFDAMAESMSKVTAQQVAAERLNNLSGALEQLKGALETAAITLGLSLLPVLTDLTKWATEAVNAIIPALDDVGKSLAAMFSSESLGEMASNLQDIRSAVEETAAALAEFWEVHGERITAATKATWSAVAGDVKHWLLQILDAIKLMAQVGAGDWEGALQTMSELHDRHSQQQVVIAQRQSEMMLAAIQTFAGEAIAATQAWVDGVAESVTGGMQAVLDAVTTGWTSVQEAVDGILPGIRDAILAVWNLIPEDIRADCEKIASVLVERGAAWVSSVAESGASMLTAITGKLGEMVDAVTTWASTTFLSPITGLAGTALTAATDVGSNILTAITGKLGEAVTAVTTWASSTFVQPIRDLAGSIGSTAESIGRAISNGIASGISATAGAIRDAAYRAARSALDAAKNALGIESPSKVFEVQVGKPIVEGVISGVKNMARPLTATMDAMVRPPMVPTFAGVAAGASIAASPPSIASGPVEVRVFLGNREFEDIFVETYNSSSRRGRI